MLKELIIEWEDFIEKETLITTGKLKTAIQIIEERYILIEKKVEPK